MFKYSMLATALLFAVSGSAMATSVTLNPTDDSFVEFNYPDDNYGAFEWACLGKYINHHIWATLLFDLSAYSGVTVNDASLQVYIYYSNGTFPPHQPWIVSVTGSWDESTITWDNKPDHDDWQEIAEAPVMQDWWRIDITGRTVEWVNGTHDNYGVFIGTNATGANDYFYFRTKEYSGTTYAPRLVLVYNETSIESASLGEIKAAFK